MWSCPSLATRTDRVGHHEVSLDRAFGMLVSLDLLTSTAAIPVNCFTMPGLSLTKPRAIGDLQHFKKHDDQELHWGLAHKLDA